MHRLGFAGLTSVWGVLAMPAAPVRRLRAVPVRAGLVGRAQSFPGSEPEVPPVLGLAGSWGISAWG